jgi:hypothetical protein
VPAGTILHRFHHRSFAPTLFNPTGTGNARFSPIKNKDGQIIPTLYAGTSFDCAAMETVFHDVPYTPGFKLYAKAKLKDHQHSVIRTDKALSLVDLTTKSLRLLGIARSDLIDTGRDHYPFTRDWAEAIHAFAPHAHGLRWVSRQDDTAIAVVLFGDRLTDSYIVDLGQGRDLIEDESAFAELMALADLIGVLFTSD